MNDADWGGSTNIILYKREYTFTDLPKLRYDFAIFDSNNNLLFLIEFDGRQHFNSDSVWFQDEKEFEDLKQRDKIKTDFCKEKGIPLIRIPYYEIKQISLDFIYKKLEKAQEIVEDEASV